MVVMLVPAAAFGGNKLESAFRYQSATKRIKIGEVTEFTKKRIELRSEPEEVFQQWDSLHAPKKALQNA